MYEFVFYLIIAFGMFFIGFAFCLLWVVNVVTYPDSFFHKDLCRLLEHEILKKTC